MTDPISTKKVYGSAETFDAANRNFKKLKRSGNPKFKNLHTWNYNKSVHLLKEISGKLTRQYKVFKRGAIIYVDFGINIGSEFSMPHFAVVLNKKDHRFNEKLTVIPLTSVKHQHTIELDNTIRDSSLSYLEESIKESATFIYSILLIIDDQNSKNSINIAEKYLEIIQKEPSIAYLQQYTSNKIKTTPDAYSYAKEHLSKVQGKPVNTISDTIINTYATKENLENITSDTQLIKQIIDMYKRYNKKTYARVEDITTISKNRIRRINYYDPIGKIRVSSETLDRIEKSLKDFLFK